MEVEWLWAHTWDFNNDSYMCRKILFEISSHVFFISGIPLALWLPIIKAGVSFVLDEAGYNFEF